jgi:Cysteine-rich CPXCG
MSRIESASVDCPYCGEAIELVIDTSVEHQQYVEDCSICCRPIVLTVVCEDDDVMSIEARGENE